jgi:transcriptional regulator with XRE-family HTH domain
MNLLIKEVLRDKNKTAVWLAFEIGITQPNMSNIVNNKVNPSLETLEKIANALNVPISDLFEQPRKDVAAITCPHCGKEINIKVE